MKVKGFFGWAAALGLLLTVCEQPGHEAPAEGETQVYETDGEVPVYEKLTAIEIGTLPDTLYYHAGKQFDPTGLEVNGVYYKYIGYDEEPEADVEPDEAVTRPLSRSSYKISAPGASAAGGYAYNVTVRYGDLPPLSFPVYISAVSETASLTDIKLTGNELSKIKKVYELGQDFDLSNINVTAYYSDNTTENIPASTCQVLNFDKRKRGTQKVTVRMNGRQLAVVDGVTVKVPQNATLTANSINNVASAIGWQDKSKTDYYKPVFIKGMNITPENLFLRVNVKANGDTITLSVLNGGITDADTITYNKDQAGLQHPELQLDEAKCALEVFFTDAAPEVYFDYGFMRHNKDAAGKGLGAGKYYVKQGGTLVLSPIRFLIGYDADYNTLPGTSYSWTVSGGGYTAPSLNGEFLYFTPSAAGDYTVSVSVNGRNFVTGQSDTKTASTQVVSFTGTADGKTDPFGGKPLKNFAPGQFTKGGTGHGWSLGTALGYEMWPISSSTSNITIQGNGFENWSEEGIVWVQDDENGNGVPDEMWYELKGSADDSTVYRNYITRRYAIKHFAYDGSTKTNEYGQPVGYTFWTDSKGRCGVMITGWPDEWGVDKAGNGVWVMYTGTILADGGTVTYTAGGLGTGSIGYVDVYNAKEKQTMVVDKAKAIRADGSAANIGNIRFIKVQTGVFSYGGPFGDVSTEIVRATGIDGDQSGGFPNPLGNQQ
jgi:hypothetical protein